MSDWHPEVVRITEVRTHDNADSLEIAIVYGTTPVIIRKGQYKAGDLVAYIPVDSTLPDLPCFGFLQPADRRRLKAKRLRGVFSMGLLVDAPACLVEGESVVDSYGLTKYEPPEPGHGPNAPREPTVPGPTTFRFPKFTDVEGYRRHPRALDVGEPVIITEKIHGSNARFCLWPDGVDAGLWVGSRTVVKERDGESTWSKLARSLGLAERLAAEPGIVIYGEIYGAKIQDLAYGAATPALVIFDAYDALARRWLDAVDVFGLADRLGLSTPPTLYRGPWSLDCLALAEGHAVLGGSHVREGFVVRPERERFHARLPDSRVVLKHVGEGYLTRKTKDVS